MNLKTKNSESLPSRKWPPMFKTLENKMCKKDNLSLTGVIPFLAVLLAVFCLPLQQAEAQVYDEKGDLYGPNYYKQRPHQIGLSFLRLPETGSENFLLRLSVTDVMSGCPELSNLEYRVTYEGPVMRVNVGEFIVDMRDLPRHPHYECDQSIKMPSAEIAMNRQTLMDRNIQAIEFSNGGAMDTYNIIMTDQYIRLQPSSGMPPTHMAHRPYDVYNVKNPLKYWFYPEKTVQLYIPGADLHDPATRDKLDSLAGNFNLMPLTEMWPDFEPPVINNNFAYYVDEDGNLPNEAYHSEDKFSLGEISVEKTVYGLEGDETEMVPLQVYVKTPGAFE